MATRSPDCSACCSPANGERLETNRGLRVDVIGVARADRRERLVDVIAREEMSVANFQLRVTRDRITGDCIKLGADKRAVTGIDPVIAAPAAREPAAWRAAHVVKTVVRVREPEAVAFNCEAEARQGLELKNTAHVLYVLQRNKIHVAVELVVRGKQIVERAVRSVVRIVIAG